MSMIKNLIRWATITSAGIDDKQFTSQQVEYLGKIADGLTAFPYGMHANAPPDTFALMFSIQGNPDNRAIIPINTKNRPTLASGEVAFFHPLLPDMLIKLQADGRMLVKSGVGIDFVAPDFTFTGNTAFTGTVTANGKVIDDTHGHVQADDSGGNTEVPISGVT